MPAGHGPEAFFHGESSPVLKGTGLPFHISNNKSCPPARQNLSASDIQQEFQTPALQPL